MNSNDVTNLELISSEMWLAHEVEHLGGWQLRFNSGITYRANSVLPISSPGLDLDDAITFVINHYQKRGHPARFQLTKYSYPPELDEDLKNRGWKMGIEVETQTMSIIDYNRRYFDYEVELLDYPDASWMECFFQNSHRERETAQARIDLMIRSKIPKKFAQIRTNSVVSCVGVGMVHSGWIGLFRLGTHPDFRRKGMASSLSDALLEWGFKVNGARHAFLQVETDNESAMKMYEKLGFENCYTYWYRSLEK